MRPSPPPSMVSAPTVPEQIDASPAGEESCQPLIEDGLQQHRALGGQNGKQHRRKTEASLRISYLMPSVAAPSAPWSELLNRHDEDDVDPHQPCCGYGRGLSRVPRAIQSWMSQTTAISIFKRCRQKLQIRVALSRETETSTTLPDEPITSGLTVIWELLKRCPTCNGASDIPTFGTTGAAQVAKHVAPPPDREFLFFSLMLQFTSCGGNLGSSHLDNVVR
jgi:hypothetical protein